MSATMRKLGAVLLVWAGQTAGAAELNALSDLHISPTANGAQVVVRGSRAPTFTVFRLHDPERLVVDLSGADANAIKGHHEGLGPVSGVVASQFSDEKASVGRVLVALNPTAQYDVRAQDNRVVISIQNGTQAMQPSPDAKAAAKAEADIAPSSTPAASASASAPVTAASRADGVIASKVDEKPVAHAATHVIGVTFSGEKLRVQTNGELPKYELIELGNPPRLALDLYGVKLATRLPKTVSSQYVGGLRAGTHSDKVRLVFDAKGEMPAYNAKRLSRGMELSIGPVATPAPAPTETVAVASSKAKTDTEPEASEPQIEIDGKKIALGQPGVPAAPPKSSTPSPAQPPVEIRDLSFDESATGGQVALKLSRTSQWKVSRPDDSSAVLTLDNARLPKSLERSLDTSALDTPVKMVSAFTAPGGARQVRIVVSAAGALEESVAPSPTGLVLTWRLSAKGVKTEQAVSSSKAASANSLAPEAVAYAAQGQTQRIRYVGNQVSFEFKDIEIHNLLRVIAEVSKKNIVVADDVSGKVTIRLRNVPWDQALELILRSKSLGKEDMGNIIRVAPLKALEEEAKLRAERQKALLAQEPLTVQLIPVNYATAGDMSSRVKEVLSERGTVTTDTRTNVLIVRDISSNIGRARSLVQNLDTQTPQVLIESRIVEAATNFTRSIGVQWGGQAIASPATGNATGLSFPNTVAVRGGSTSEGATGTADNPNFAVNLPAAVGTGSGGALGFTFGSAGGAFALNLRLSALENQGTVKTISAPKVTTLDNNTARISQGVSIPFSQVSAQGVNTTFVEARLSLEVTPHITQDGSILMNIRAENNQPDPSNSGANGQPAIQRKEANTQVLVKDGDTTVIGGIYVRRGANNEQRIPFLGRIPVLGFFFKNYTESDARQELLIFITPRIINRQTPVAQNP